MKVNNIQNNTPNFKGFFLNANGAQELAEKFVKCPELEERFMANIVKPLDNSVCDVFYDGYAASVKGPNDKNPLSVLFPNTTLDQSILGTVAENFSRNVYRRRSPITPTKVFEDAHPLNVIEAAKNIAIDKEYEESSRFLKQYSNETVNEKAKRLFKRFSIEG